MSNPAFTIPLPKSWPAKVRSATLQVVSLAKYAAVYTRSWAADCPKARGRFRVEREAGRVVLRARCLTRWSPASQAPNLTWKLSMSPGMPTCRWSDCDAQRSLICVSGL
jgi:hypothetical protein